MAACFIPTTCVWGGNTAPPTEYTWVSANNNTWRCQNKKHFMPGHLVFTPGWAGPPRCMSPLDIPSTWSVTHQIITGTLWEDSFYFPSASNVFLLDGNWKSYMWHSWNGHSIGCINAWKRGKIPLEVKVCLVSMVKCHFLKWRPKKKRQVNVVWKH